MTEMIPQNNFDNIPFEEQAKYGIINSFLLTVAMAVRTPTAFFARMHVNKGVKLPLLFMLIILTFSNIMNYVYITNDIIDSPSELFIKTLESEPELKDQSDKLKEMFSGTPQPSDIFLSILTGFVFLYIIALYWHFILRSMKTALNGFEATLRVFCYSSVVLLSSVIPTNSPFFNFVLYIWWAYIMYVGISEAHEVSRNLAWRGVTVSLFASIIPVIFLILAFF